VLWPKLSKVLADHPDLKVEIIVDYGLSDIAADRFDIGVRYGDQVAKEMIAVRIAPGCKMAIVYSPSYLEQRAPPESPQDLLSHNCITLHLPTKDDIYAWELKKGGREPQVRVDGQVTVNGMYQMINAALDGAGLAFVPEEMIRHHVATGRLRSVMADCCPEFPGLHIFYPSRRESSRAMSVVVDALRFRA